MNHNARARGLGSNTVQAERAVRTLKPDRETRLKTETSRKMPLHSYIQCAAELALRSILISSLLLRARSDLAGRGSLYFSGQDSVHLGRVRPFCSCRCV